MLSKPLCKLSLFFAEKEPIVVILRQGPSRWTEMIVWNTKEDTFKRGQWMVGKIYVERCDLSPDGKLFVYFAVSHSQFDSKKGYSRQFTAICRPPYFTALAYWPSNSTYGGGGRFISDKKCQLAYWEGGTMSPQKDITELYMSSMIESHPDHKPKIVIETNLDHYDKGKGYNIGNLCHNRLNWSGFDHFHREILIEQGKIYRKNENEKIMLINFNGDEFKKVEAPDWAQKWQ